MPDTEGAFHAITTDSDSAMSEYICVLLEGQLTGTTVKRITGHACDVNRASLADSACCSREANSARRH